MATLKGYMHYERISTPGTKWESEEKAWSIQLEVDEKTAKAFKKKYKKQDQAVKEFDTEEFVKRFKCDPQVNSKESDEHFVITLRQDCKVNGKPWNKPPRLFIKSEDGKKLVDVTGKLNVENGAEVVVQVSEIKNAKYNNVSAKLKGVRIDKYVEYKEEGFDELGDVDEESLQELKVQEDDEPNADAFDNDDDDAPFDTDDDDVY